VCFPTHPLPPLPSHILFFLLLLYPHSSVLLNPHSTTPCFSCLLLSYHCLLVSSFHHKELFCFAQVNYSSISRHPSSLTSLLPPLPPSLPLLPTTLYPPYIPLLLALAVCSCFITVCLYLSFIKGLFLSAQVNNSSGS
jgi:hypothetical protein